MRASPPSPAALLHEILQWGPHASIPGERCTGLARRRARRAHSLSPNLGRTASPICQDLIYDRHSLQFAGDGKVKVHYSTERLEDINSIFGRMRDNKIDGRVVMKI
jgi:hypothetical protein